MDYTEEFAEDYVESFRDALVEPDAIEVNTNPAVVKYHGKPYEVPIKTLAAMWHTDNLPEKKWLADYCSDLLRLLLHGWEHVPQQLIKPEGQSVLVYGSLRELPVILDIQGGSDKGVLVARKPFEVSFHNRFETMTDYLVLRGRYGVFFPQE